MEKILFTGENGEKVEFFVIEEAKLNGTNYLLVTENEDDEEAMAYIMKQVAKTSDKDLTYEFVEDEKEIEAVAGLLEELLDGEVDLVPEDEA
ncbi:MAG: DUF1292 domain-containing protein [Lachnospiraceae bacterium]|nr:DUF1292 domain-containing protein [Lachnospiraceae bacterium]MBO7633354.1 DUF1292 domain-containing protein [Lachnospiraceae bacterium]